MAQVAGHAGHRLRHIMIPKVESVDDVVHAERTLLRHFAPGLPLHALIESPAAVHRRSTSPRIRACSRSASA
jgi:citrate lyase subunit beta/citryl-CoA lyase